MPTKHPKKKGWNVRKQKYKVSNWHDYNNALRNRGKIELWIASDIADAWYEKDRVYNGTGTPKKFSDFSILICHEIRQVFHLPLRQTQGFIDSIFSARQLDLVAPDYSCLSKRLSILNIKTPRYKETNAIDDEVISIAIDSTGLKHFGRGEWHQEKHKVSGKRSWRKLHIAVDNKHIIHASDLTDRFSADCKSVETLAKQIDTPVDHMTADGAYDTNSVYQTLSNYFSNSDIVIPPDSDAVYNKGNHAQRNRNLQEIKTFGRMIWQRVRNYGRRNYSELCIQRYKKILGNQMRARELARQKNEAVIGCGILNKMTNLGMPISYRCA